MGGLVILTKECHERRVMIRDAALLCLPGQKCETSRDKMEGPRILFKKISKTHAAMEAHRGVSQA